MSHFLVLSLFLCCLLSDLNLITYYAYKFTVCIFYVISRYKKWEKKCACTFGMAFSEAERENRGSMASHFTNLRCICLCFWKGDLRCRNFSKLPRKVSPHHQIETIASLSCCLAILGQGQHAYSYWKQQLCPLTYSNTKYNPRAEWFPGRNGRLKWISIFTSDTRGWPARLAGFLWKQLQCGRAAGFMRSHFACCF